MYSNCEYCGNEDITINQTQDNKITVYCNSCKKIFIKDNNEYENIHIEIENSFGFQIHAKLRQLNTYKIFYDRNLIDLANKIKEYKENKNSLWRLKYGGKRELDDFMIDFLRYLHNFLMSLYSLKEKTISLRNHLNKRYGDVIPEVDYSKKLHEFKIEEYAGFLENLRRDFAHGIEDEGTAQISFSYDLMRNDTYILLNKKDLTKILYEYNKGVNNFYEWFSKRLYNIFSFEIEKTNKLIRKSNEINN